MDSHVRKHRRSAAGARLKLWTEATARGPGGKSQIGYWGMELARRLVESQKVPVCILNGAVGGTRIDQHQRNNADPEDVATIYGRLLWRVHQARLTHGIRGVLWHQGENDQGADGPTGGFGYETYRQYFLDLSSAWKQDYPNIRHYYVFQIWPKSCAMGFDGSDNRLREVQRTLPTAFSNLSVMSTLGIDPPGGCHYPPAGYAEIARLICPLLERDFYGKKFAASITPPNLKRAAYPNAGGDQVVLEFDQPVKWDDVLAGQFYLDGQGGKIQSGTTTGNQLTLKLAAGAVGKTITYLDSKAWSQAKLLRRGERHRHIDVLRNPDCLGSGSMTFLVHPNASFPSQVEQSSFTLGFQLSSSITYHASLHLKRNAKRVTSH